MRKTILLALLFTVSGCDFYRFHSGRFYASTRRYLPAIRAFETFAASRPGDPRAAEALVRSGEIYATRFKRCRESRRDFEAALRRFPAAEPWASRAKAGLMGCPDYFPIDLNHRWVYGDTESQGSNMRLQWQMNTSSGSAHAEITTALYAGAKKIRDGLEVYEKRDWTIWQSDGQMSLPILKYPFRRGMTWSAQKPEGKMVYSIESDAESVAVVAGEFKDCLKVKEQDSRFPDTWTYQYYAPDVGRVKTTIAGEGFENPNTELIKFDKIGSR